MDARHVRRRGCHRTFFFRVPGGGSASGHITGTVNDFTLTGTYGNGSPATLHMVRS